MNEDGTPIEGAEADNRPAGTVEGSAEQPTTDDVAKMYDELGIKAPAPTGATKGRPKASDVRDKDAAKKDPGSAKAGKSGNGDDKDKSKDAPASDKDDASRDKADPKASEKRGADGKVQGESDGADKGVHSDKSAGKGTSEQGSEEDADDGASGAGKDEGESEDEAEKGKRPGKSDPKVEQRFQKLSAESKAAIEARDAEIEKLQKQIRDTQLQQQQTKVAQEDPEYTVEDFRKVRDENGNVLELDPNQAELAYRRWKDGYDQRKVEREAQYNHEQAIEEYKAETTRKMVESSVQAYDTLVGILDTYPELNPQAEEFDQQFSDDIMPIIEDMIIYQPGTEPGNEAGNQAVIVGMRMNPNKILDVINRVKTQKRSLPLNGTDDNVEVRSNVSVPHGRSSDPTVNAANDLYKELGIKKRL